VDGKGEGKKRQRCHRGTAKASVFPAETQHRFAASALSASGCDLGRQTDVDPTLLNRLAVRPNSIGLSAIVRILYLWPRAPRNRNYDFEEGT
jgi:hypothetical protein